MQVFDIIIIGGGAAGYYGAITAASCSTKRVLILEKTQKVLSKVRISGGGRCNVTHGCFEPKELVKHYPRGSKELLGPFTRFQPRDTIEWFEHQGVRLKIEEDGRVFPVTDSSETIINALTESAKSAGVELQLGVHVKKIDKGFQLESDNGIYKAGKLLLATGSSPQGHQFATSLGHTVTPLVPSLFTFNTPSSPLLDLAGISVDKVCVRVNDLTMEGPILLTHWGFSGPAVLKLSAWGARELHAQNYHTKLYIDWTSGMSKEELLQKIKSQPPQQIVSLDHLVSLPKNLAKRLLTLPPKRYAELSKKDIDKLIEILQMNTYEIEGKTTYKQEFVTCGGVKLSEVNFKTMESKICPGLYFAGEILDIDGVTGGFNFQNAWTTSWIAGQSMSS